MRYLGTVTGERAVHFVRIDTPEDYRRVFPRGRGDRRGFAPGVWMIGLFSMRLGRDLGAGVVAAMRADGHHVPPRVERTFAPRGAA